MDVVMVSCALRNLADEAGWRVIEDQTHIPLLVDQVITTSTYVKVVHPVNAYAVVGASVTPDETYAQDIRVGVSVGLDYSIIKYWHGQPGSIVDPRTLVRPSGNVWFTVWLAT